MGRAKPELKRKSAQLDMELRLHMVRHAESSTLLPAYVRFKFSALRDAVKKERKKKVWHFPY
jgi:hypothetical protein